MFKRTFPLLLLACLVTGSAWSATDSFVGDWKLDASKSTYIDRMKVDSLGANKYAFDFGGSSETIVADGSDQPGYAGTMLSVKQGPDFWTVVRKQNGRMMLTATWRLSSDGDTLTDIYTEFGANGSPSTTNFHYKRTTAGQGFAGTWERPIDLGKAAPGLLLQIRPYEESGLTFLQPRQQVTRSMKFDGKDYPDVGQGVAPGSTSSGRRVDARTLELTQKVGGKVTRTEQIKLSSDLKILTRTLHPVGQHDPNVLVFERQ
jgi:hypothetical protein